MNSFFFVIGDYLKGKSVYQPISRILNLLFSLSIASFLFEKFYFHYEWLEISDYKSILDFLIKGHFIVPFAIFLIVHYLLSYGSDALFTLITYRAVNKWQTNAYNLELTKKESNKLLKKINRNSFVDLPQKIDIPTLISWYKYIKSTTDTSTWIKLRSDVEQTKINNIKNFNLAIKSLIVITIYFTAVPYFGWLLYSIVLLVIIFLILGIRTFYILMHFLPIVIQRLISETEKYIEEHPDYNSAGPKR